jgi:hypothetical protein
MATSASQNQLSVSPSALARIQADEEYRIFSVAAEHRNGCDIPQVLRHRAFAAWSPYAEVLLKTHRFFTK